MVMVRAVIAASLVAGCGSQRLAEDPSLWYDEGSNINVEEPVSFTDEPYTLPLADEDGIQVLHSEVLDISYGTLYAEAELAAVDEADCDWDTTSHLPIEIEGIVTIHPRFYFKSNGCTYDDEKYYGSYFIEDRTGGILVLGDSKVAHFDMGDRVRIAVRGARRSFGLNMVYAHDVMEIERAPFPISYVETNGPLVDTDIGEVRRVVGVVMSDMDTFGQIWLQPDGVPEECQPDTATGTGCVGVSLDVELTRRGVGYSPGTRIEVTGPVLFSYDIHSIVVMRIGQVTVLD